MKLNFGRKMNNNLDTNYKLIYNTEVIPISLLEIILIDPHRGKVWNPRYMYDSYKKLEMVIDRFGPFFMMGFDSRRAGDCFLAYF